MTRRFTATAMTFGLFLAISNTAHAGEITCSGTASNTNQTYVFFDASANTCNVQDADPSGSFATGDIYFRLLPSFSHDNTSRAYAYPDNQLRGFSDNYDYISCNIGDDGVKTSGGCQDKDVASGTYTNSVQANIAANSPATMTVNYTVVKNTSITVNSASVVTPDPSSSNDVSTPESLRSDVAKSQAVVIATNINSRISTIGSPVGISRNTPGGVGRETPGGIGRDTPTGVGRTVPQKQKNLWEESSQSDTRVEGNSLRQLAMAASFDTSEIFLAAANSKEGQIPTAPQSREKLLIDRPFTVWGHGSYSSVKNERNRVNDDSRYDGDVWGYNFGMDYRFNPKLYAGMSLGYSDTDLTTIYNSGTYDETNWSLTPYAVYQATENLKLSALGGYSVGKLDQTRNSGSVTSSTDSDMWFLSLNASYKFKPNPEVPLDLTANASFMASHKTIDAYTESNGNQIDKATSNTRQIKPGIEAAYSFDADGTIIQPFAKVDFIYDLKDTVNNDNNAFDVGGGLRIGNGDRGISGSIEGQSQLGRSDYKEYSVSGMLSYGFDLGGDKDRLVKPFVQSGFDGKTQAHKTGVSYVHQLGFGEVNADLTHSLAQKNANDNTAATVKFKMSF